MADSPDFIPYTQGAPDFIPYQPTKAPQTTIGPRDKSAVLRGGENYNDPVDSYFRDAENLTQEGAKAHPVENFIGQTANKAKIFRDIIGTMAPLFMGPGGTTPAEGMHESPLPDPITVKQLPERAGGSLVTPAPRMSMREQLGSTLPVEPSANAPAAQQAAPGATVATQPTATASPAPTTPIAPPSTSSLLRRLGQQIEDSARRPAVEPTAQALPARGTLGAKTVTEQPNDIVQGPAIKTPSRNSTLGDIARLQTGITTEGRQPGVEFNPLERGVSLKDQPPSTVRTPAQVPEETVHPMDRQFIHVNGAQAFEKTAGKPALQEDLLNLEGEQLREVLRKSGEDMTKVQTVGRSAGKSTRGGAIIDPANISRQEAFDILFEKGYTPEQIVKESPPRSKPAPFRKAFGPPRDQK